MVVAYTIKGVFLNISRNIYVILHDMFSLKNKIK